MNLASYIRLIRFHYHITFSVVIIGALVLAHQPIYTLVAPLIIMYISFNVLLYGALYTLNDIADVKSDSNHPKKKNRPLPSGEISILSAYIFALAMLVIALATAYFYFGTAILLLFLLFIAVNIFYTRVAKRIPYLEILFNSLTYPMRFLLGALLVASSAPYPLLWVVLLFAIGVSCVRRVIERREKGSEARKVLKYYTDKKLAVIQIVAWVFVIIILIIDYPHYLSLYTLATLLYFVFVFGIYFSKHISNFYVWAFLK